MREAMTFCAGMMFVGLLIAEVWFGAMRPKMPPSTRHVRNVRLSDRKPSDDDRPPPPEEPGTRAPDAGKPSPLQPRPGHHLVAANALPPDGGVYLLPKD